MQQIALLLQSKHVTAAQASLIAQAVSKQLHYHASPAWGTSAWSCVFYSSESLVPATAMKLYILDDADTAGALGYHDTDPQGDPYGRVFVKPILSSGGDILSSANSVSVTVSHEALEMFGDREANLWAVMPSGSLLAVELCDPVESDAYPVVINLTTVMVSNFVFPEYFANDDDTTRFDYMKRLSAPWTMTPNGYQIVMTGGKVSNVWGKRYPSWKKKSKVHPAARTARRNKR